MIPAARVTLRGRLVRLEPLSNAHAGDLLLAATSGESAFDFTYVPQSADAMAAYVAAALRDEAAGASLPFATRDLRSGQIVGSTRFMNLEYWKWAAPTPLARPPGCPDAVEIGSTWLAAPARRTHVNTEAKLLMLAHAFEAWQVHRVTLKTDARNAQSRAAIERIGGKLGGVLRAHMPSSDGRVRDSAYFTLLASEWPSAKQRLEARLAR